MLQIGLRVGVVTLLLATAAAASCSKEAATNVTGAASSSGSGAGGACSTYSCSACGICVASSCSSELATCNGDPECASYASCVSACPLGKDGNADPTCVSGCPLGSSTSSQKAAEAYLACRQKGPGASCAACNVSLSPPPTNMLLNQTCGASTDTDPCGKCEAEKCCDTETAYHNEPDSQAYVTCITACTGSKSQMQTCQYQCDLAHKAGALAFQRLGACMEYYCAVDVVSPPATTACDESERGSCQKCEYETCGDEYADLVETLDGVLLTDCDTACAFNDAACDSACLTMYPDANAAWYGYGDCVTQACSAVCM